MLGIRGSRSFRGGPERECADLPRDIWAKGEGLLRTSTLDSSKVAAPLLALPQFAVDMLLARSQEERLNLCGAIFPSAAGSLRDPNGFARQRREVRGELGEHLEKATATASARRWATWSPISLPTLKSQPMCSATAICRRPIKHYLSRGRAHPEVATMVDYVVRGRRKVTKRSAKRRV
jgi:hypothetical protein